MVQVILHRNSSQRPVRAAFMATLRCNNEVGMTEDKCRGCWKEGKQALSPRGISSGPIHQRAASLRERVATFCQCSVPLGRCINANKQVVVFWGHLRSMTVVMATLLLRSFPSAASYPRIEVLMGSPSFLPSSSDRSRFSPDSVSLLSEVLLRRRRISSWAINKQWFSLTAPTW